MFGKDKTKEMLREQVKRLKDDVKTLEKANTVLEQALLNNYGALLELVQKNRALESRCRANENIDSITVGGACDQCLREVIGPSVPSPPPRILSVIAEE